MPCGRGLSEGGTREGDAREEQGEVTEGAFPVAFGRRSLMLRGPFHHAQ